MALLCVPFIFVHHEKCRFFGRHVMASIRLPVIFIVATLITIVLFKQLLLHNGGVFFLDNKYVSGACDVIVSMQYA